VTGLQVLNELPVAALPDGAMLELGSFYAGETRRVLIKLAVPGIAALGLAQVATLDFTHVSLPDLVQHTTSVPVHVNVVPGDQAAGRIPDPKVRSEALFQQTQKAKLQSSRLLSEGRVDEASRLLHITGANLRADSASLPPAMAASWPARPTSWTHSRESHASTWPGRRRCRRPTPASRAATAGASARRTAAGALRRRLRRPGARGVGPAADASRPPATPGPRPSRVTPPTRRLIVV
jgi:hypothetical protein